MEIELALRTLFQKYKGDFFAKQQSWCHYRSDEYPEDILHRIQRFLSVTNGQTNRQWFHNLFSVVNYARHRKYAIIV